MGRNIFDKDFQYHNCTINLFTETRTYVDGPKMDIYEVVHNTSHQVLYVVGTPCVYKVARLLDLDYNTSQFYVES